MAGNAAPLLSLIAILFRLLQVRPHDLDQVLGPFGLVWVLLVRGIDHVMTDVIFEKLDCQPVHSTTNRGDQHQYVGAAEFGFQRALDRLDLSLDATDTAGELRFVLDRMHGNNIRGYPILIKSRLAPRA